MHYFLWIRFNLILLDRALWFSGQDLVPNHPPSLKNSLATPGLLLFLTFSVSGLLSIQVWSQFLYKLANFPYHWHFWAIHEIISRQNLFPILFLKKDLFYFLAVLGLHCHMQACIRVHMYAGLRIVVSGGYSSLLTLVAFPVTERGL